MTDHETVTDGGKRKPVDQSEVDFLKGYGVVSGIIMAISVGGLFGPEGMAFALPIGALAGWKLERRLESY